MMFLFAFLALVAAQKCGTARHDLSSLAALQDYVEPAGSSCSSPQCTGGLLPWSMYVQICGPVRASGPMFSNCAGAAICQQWPGDSASLGTFSSVQYSDISNGVLVSGSGGTSVGGTSRSFNLAITCSPKSDPFPVFVSESPTTLTYNFTWNRAELCKSAPPTPPPPTPPATGCLAALQQLQYCFTATASCTCFNNAPAAFQKAGCGYAEPNNLQAELLCLSNGCSSKQNMFCNF